MTAPAPKALTRQRPLADGALRIVARGLKEDSLPRVTVTAGVTVTVHLFNPSRAHPFMQVECNVQ
jgi:hypothetical protein